MFLVYSGVGASLWREATLAINPVDLNKIVETILSNLPATIAALVAAGIAWHNRAVSRDTNTVAKETKVMVNGRMDQLLLAAAQLAELKGRIAQSAETQVNQAATDKAVVNAIKEERRDNDIKATATSAGVGAAE